MAKTSGFCDGNAYAAVVLYAERFPRQHHPDGDVTFCWAASSQFWAYEFMLWSGMTFAKYVVARGGACGWHGCFPARY
jgi:hypothetical protein